MKVFNAVASFKKRNTIDNYQFVEAISIIGVIVYTNEEDKLKRVF
jgi:hypothetical protein